jgi:hypothetical protein
MVTSEIKPHWQSEKALFSIPNRPVGNKPTFLDIFQDIFY